jgi:hypothetical protein
MLHRTQDWLSARDGVFEVTGLKPPILRAMDDPTVAEVFAIYRASLDELGPLAGRQAALRFPQGLDEVAEPHTPARHRAVIAECGP